MTEKEVNELYKLAKFTIKTFNLPYSEDLIQDMVLHAFLKYNNDFDKEKAKKSTFLVMVMHQVYLKNTRSETFDKRKINNMTVSNIFRDATNNEYDVFELFPEEKSNVWEKEYFLKEIEPFFNEELKLFLKGYKKKEIASIFNVSSTIINKRIKRNIEKIRTYLIENDKYDSYKEVILNGE